MKESTEKNKVVDWKHDKTWDAKYDENSNQLSKRYYLKDHTTEKPKIYWSESWDATYDNKGEQISKIYYQPVDDPSKEKIMDHSKSVFVSSGDNEPYNAKDNEQEQESIFSQGIKWLKRGFDYLTSNEEQPQ
ncbi:hypothetical protein ['Catharanthus roseus' aster yellows phytoplasma]|uniref:Uncharacterized protein n=1 Tax='Catharanthus roseus' aster yellows phytoplasma TaxID=1193712 RepID=A0A4P6MED9_9MOLU|nr:hypothetical protein ['Catharanthus roseus' aster yellows phytoplasma]QBF24001.1 hypothetical protein EXT02_02315 ['Catharanthus roseus' aster yellows phytoplasma]